MINKKQKIKFKWFTLVELIIVITILAILATIAFTYFSWYAWNARNSKRISDIKNIEKSLELKITTVWKTPLPDSLVKINSEDTLIWYQWEVWKNVVSFLSLWWDFKDPSTWENYLYLTNWLTNKWQVAAYMEENNSTWTWYLSKTPTYTWSPLWLILEKDNSPIHKNQSIISAWWFNTLTWAFVNEDVKILLWKDNLLHKPFIIWGQLLQLSKWYSFEPPKNCPKNYIPVPWDVDLWQPWFCVWKYEASYEFWSNTNLITTEWKPVATGLQYNWPLCFNNWFTMITALQRLTIARNIERNPENWSGWKVWVWYIKTWNSWDNTTWFSNSGLLPNWPSWNTANDEKRQLKLSNWEIIWDFIWNAWEVVAPLNLSNWENELDKYAELNPSQETLWKYLSNYLPDWADTDHNYKKWIDHPKSDFKTIFWPINDIDSPSNGKFKYLWYWRFFLMWWSYGNTEVNAWLYSILKFNIFDNWSVSTRCTYIK